MITQEGVIRFALEHTDSVPPRHPALASLRQWHSKLHAAGLISQDSQRYGGYAYGNMSIRLHKDTFIISGTQTAGLEKLEDSHYATVDKCDIQHNRVQSHGPVKPSSECMTHASIYMATVKANAIVHVHSPLIWHHYKELGIATTAADIEYGTPTMAKAVHECIAAMQNKQRACIAMLGHEDGVICFAETVESASEMALHLLQKAKEQG